MSVGRFFVAYILLSWVTVSVGVWWESVQGVCLGGAALTDLDWDQTDNCSLCKFSGV